MMNRNPCCECTERTAECHGICGRYKAWKSVYNEQKKEQKEQEKRKKLTRSRRFYAIGFGMRERKGVQK